MDDKNKYLKYLAYFLLAGLFIVPLIWCRYLNQNYVSTKWITVDYLTVLAALGLLVQKKIHIPAGRILTLTGVLLALKLITSAQHFHYVSYYNLAESICFATLCVYFLNVWQNQKLDWKNIFWLYVPSALVVSSFVLYQFVNSRILKGETEPFYYNGTFGNINMMSEYVVFLLPLGFFLTRNEKTPWKKALLTVCVTSWVFLILIGQGRSAWMGLGLCFAYSLIKGMQKREWIMYALPLVLFMGTKYIPYKGPDYALAKEGSLAKRSELYKGSSLMLLDSPLGIGGGNFPFSYMPYQMATKEPPTERERFDTPHNELIKWGIEQGWAFLLVNCLWWLALGWAVFKIPGSPDLQIFYRTSYLVIGPQIFFQFPFDNPSSSFAMAFIFSIFFLNTKTKELSHRGFRKIATALVVLVVAGKAISFSTAKYIESQKTYDMNALEFGCQINPANWYVCFLYSMKKLNSAFPHDVLPQIEKSMERRPFDYQALRILGLYYIDQKDLNKACSVTKVYDSLFLGQGVFRGINAQFCSSFESPVKFESSQQFRDDYLEWLRKTLPGASI